MQKPTLNRFDFTMIMVTLVIGMGIFRTPASVAEQSPTPFIFFAVWIFGGLIAICGALTYAEIGSRYPVTGGYYKVFSYAYHPSIAFGINCIILISDAASVSGIALVGAEYVVKLLLPNAVNTEAIQIIIAIASILILFTLNLAGLKMSARTHNVLTLIKIGFIILLISPLFFYNDQSAEHISTAIVSPSVREYIKAFGLGLVAVSFTYGGYQQSINFGAEVKNPAKNIPKGIIYGLIIIIILYLTINYAYFKIIGFTELKSSTNIAAIMASKVLGNGAGNILSILLFLSVLAYANVQLMSAPRVIEAMSNDGVMPKLFGKRTVKSNVLIPALSLFASLIIIIIFEAKKFDEILSFSIFLDCFGMVLSAAAIFKLRRATTHLDQTVIYKMKLFPFLPIIFMLTYTFIATIIFIDKPFTGLLGVGILLAFILLFFLVKKQTINTTKL